MAASRKATWIGWVITVLPCLLFGVSAFFKIHGGPEMEKGLAHLGIPVSMMMPLAILEITCVVIYLIPPSAVLGAILLTGYLGGAICTHWRVGDPFYAQFGLGVVLWLGIYLREDRLRPLIPIRRS
jgi:DoxX-like family